MGDRRVIDVHTHFLPRTLLEALKRRVDLPRASAGPSGAKDLTIEYVEGHAHPVNLSMGDLDERIADMDRHGIDLALLSVNIPGVDWFPREDGVAVAQAVNDELADLVGAHPDRLAFLATLPMQDPEAAATELHRAVARGARGCLIYSNVAGRHLDEPAFRVVFEAAADSGLPLCIHPTYPLSAKSVDVYALMTTAGFLFDTTTAALRLIVGGLYERHRDFKLVLPHAASLIPQLAGRMDIEADMNPKGYGAISVRPSEHVRLLYTDTICGWAPALQSALQLLGPDRVMYGTDYPFWASQVAADTLETAHVSPEVAEAIRSSNAERLFGLAP